MRDRDLPLDSPDFEDTPRNLQQKWLNREKSNLAIWKKWLADAKKSGKRTDYLENEIRYRTKLIAHYEKVLARPHRNPPGGNMAKKKSKGKAAKPMQVVSLKSVLSLMKSAEHRISARKMPHRSNPFHDENPKRHYPKLVGRGRPEKKRTFKVVSTLSNGMVSRGTIKATRSQAEAFVQRVLKTKPGGHPVKHVTLDDRR